MIFLYISLYIGIALAVMVSWVKFVNDYYDCIEHSICVGIFWPFTLPVILITVIFKLLYMLLEKISDEDNEDY